MTFLEKIKAKRAAENQAAAAAKDEPVKVVPKKAEASEPVKVETPKKSALSGLLARKKAAEAKNAAEALKTISPAIAEGEKKKASVVDLEAKAAAMIKESKEKAAEADDEPKADEPVVEKKVEETAENPAPAAEEAVETPSEDAATKAEEPKEEKAETEEEAPKKKRRTRNTKKNSTKKNDDGAAEDKPRVVTMLNAREFQIQNIVDTKMSFEEMVAKYESSFEDEAWTAYQQEIISELEEIRVAADMNPGMLRVTLTQLSDLDGKITIEHAKFKALLESLTNKEDGVCTCIRYQAMAVGSNENERRANGYAALSNASYKGETINFVNLIAGTRMKFIFLDSIKKRIAAMSQMCITFLGAMKVENSMDAMASSSR